MNLEEMIEKDIMENKVEEEKEQKVVQMQEQADEPDQEAEEQPEEVIERPYQLRKLKDGDLIPLLSLFRKLGLKEFKDTLQNITDGASLEEIGISAVLSMGDVVIANLEGAAGADIYAFYSDMSGIPVEDMKEMEFGTLPLMIYDSFSEVKNTSFFKVLSKLL